MGYIGINSVLSTTIIDTKVDVDMEKIKYFGDNILLNILFLIMFIALGYLLYIKREKSMSRGGSRKVKALRALNYFYYFKLLYKYIKDFNKDRNILFYEINDLEFYIYKIKDNNKTNYIRKELNLIKNMLKENSLSIEFQNYLQNIIIFLKN